MLGEKKEQGFSAIGTKITRYGFGTTKIKTFCSEQSFIGEDTYKCTK
jgi:hypothetical protein